MNMRAVHGETMSGVDVQAKQRKAVLRKSIETVLSNLSDEQVANQSANITQQVLHDPKFISAQSISLYLSTSREVNTTDILRAALDQGKACYVPRYAKSSDALDMVRLHSMEDFDTLPLTRWNIKQPKTSEQRESVFDTGHLDLILLPGVAFSPEGARLGHGKGYYDRFLARCRRELKSVPWCAGLALREQVLPEQEIPIESNDERLDCIICPQ